VASSSRTGSGVRQIVVVIVLLLLLLALAFSYYMLTRELRTEGQGERDRNFLFSVYGYEGDLLRRPTGVAFDNRGNIYVADTGKRRIVVFDGDGNYIRVFGDAGRAPLGIWDPIDVGVTSDGRVFVVDKSQQKLVEFDQNGTAVRDIVLEEEAPTSITVTDENLLVTTESGVLVASLEGDLLTGYIKRGKEPGQFDRPGGVAVGKDGTLYVADSLNYRVQAIGSNGVPIWQYGKPIPPESAVQYDSPDRKFGLPASIAVDDNDLIYVVDGLNHEIQVLDTNGEPIETIGDTGHEDGSFYYPDGIDYHDGRLVIADKMNDRVEVFETPLPPGQAWRSYVPYAAVLLLLPLLLLPFLFRGRKFVVTDEFIALLAEDEDRDLIVDALKKVYAAPTVAASGDEMEELGLRWLARAPDSDRVQLLESNYGISQEQAEAIVVAARLRGRRLLIAEDEAVKAAAEELKISVVSYAEIKAAIGEDESQKTSQGEDAEAEGHSRQESSESRDADGEDT